MEPGEPAIDLDVIHHAPPPPRPVRRTIIVAALLACAGLGYWISHRPGAVNSSVTTVAHPAPTRPHAPVPPALLESAIQIVPGGEAGGGVGVRTGNGPATVSAQGVTPGTYQVNLVCVGTGTVTVFLSDGPPGDGPPSAELTCAEAAGPAVTVRVTLRQPAFALLARPAADTLAAVGWSAQRV